LISPQRKSEEEVTKVSPRSAISMIRQRIPRIPSPSTPPLVSTYSPPSLNKEFSRPESETKSIIGLKEIAMLLGETLWELDQRLKGLIHEANVTLIDG